MKKYDVIMQNARLCFLLLTLSISGCSTKEDTSQMSFLSIRDKSFINTYGNTVVLNGINHVIKDKNKNYLYDDDELLFRRLAKSGFNCIRYGIIWDGLEPEPGVINEDYLKEIDKRVKWAEENNIWLILDMHQDLFSVKYSDGAPLWATLDDDMPHATGDVWSDAYLVSPAIQRVFDNFWDNKVASDGIGIQDHYIEVWRVLAQRYANAPSVLGFDIMNEPFMGSGAQSVFQKFLEPYAAFISNETGQNLSEQELIDLWGNEEMRLEALKNLDNKDLYSMIVDNAYEEVRTFEEGALSSFYQKVRDSIRGVNDKHILFLEHNYFCNLGVKSSFSVPVDKDGIQDSLCAYAPHGYDLVTDTRDVANPGINRVEVIFDRIFERGKTLNIPIIVGEWGAFTKGEKYIAPTSFLISLFEKNLVGQTYWCWWPSIEDELYYQQVLSRPYPMRINGELITYANDFAAGAFNCEWLENGSEENSRFYLPDLSMYNVEDIRVEPQSEIKIIDVANEKFGYLEIKPIQQNGKVRKLILRKESR